MSWLILVFFVLLLIRVPLAFSAGIVAMLFIWLSNVSTPLSLVMDAFQAMDKFTLLAVPMFILAGQFMATGGVARRFLDVADELIGGIKGGFALTTIVACVFFADLSGSSPATVAAIGVLMIPAMIKQGYDPAFAAAVSACSGVLAIIIPPSNPMIIYSLVGDASVGRLFLAGFIPGLLLAIGIAIPAYLVSKKNGWGGIQKERNIKTFAIATWNAKWALLIPVIILGGIYSGAFSPTESAAVACLYSFLIGLLVYKEFTLREVPNILKAAIIPIATVMIVVVFATVLGTALTLDNVPTRLAYSIKNATDNPIIMLIIINLLLLGVGCIMDTLSAIIILTPLLLPIVRQYGIDPVHFGLIMIINLGIGFVTPPFGANLFIANQISGVRITYVFKAAVPLVLGMIVVLLLITYVPWFTMVIPNFFYN